MEENREGADESDGKKKNLQTVHEWNFFNFFFETAVVSPTAYCITNAKEIIPGGFHKNA